MDKFRPITVLTIAGSDPGGGAGIQADLRLFNFLAAYGLSVVTAVTSQNTQEVKDVFPLPRTSIESQLEAVIADGRIAATKTGILATADAVEAVAEYEAGGSLGALIVDPVINSTTGTLLIEPEAYEVIRSSLIPRCSLITPNIEEAEVLTGMHIEKKADAASAAKKLVEMGAKAACVTGGHLPGPPTDVLFDGSETEYFEGTRGGEGREFHGTGCLFSAALTCYIARGYGLKQAITDAKRMVQAAIAGSVAPGKGMRVPWLGVRLEPEHPNL